MSTKSVIIGLAVIGFTALVFAFSGPSHEFSEGQCYHCHIDPENNPVSFQPSVSTACNACHLRLEKKKSHPSDIYPSMTVPADMPLVDGKLTCITCHFAHPKENFQFYSKKHYYLRRQVKGVFFCTECHKIDSKGHIVFANIHEGSYVVTDTTTRIDRMSLECIECHDTYINDSAESLGAGTWNHFRESLPHPIGISYKKIQRERMREFKPPGMLNKEIRLFNDNIGCGTCHNIYSKVKNMLVMEDKGELCLQCHNK